MVSVKHGAPLVLTSSKLTEYATYTYLVVASFERGYEEFIERGYI